MESLTTKTETLVVYQGLQRGKGDSSMYEFFTDPLWQSIGVILGTVGVFIGAYLGAKFGYLETLKLQRNEQEDAKKAHLQLLLDEFRFNNKCLKDIETYLTKNPPLENTFDAAYIGSTHMKVSAWDALVTAKLFPTLKGDMQIRLQVANIETRNIIRLIQMEVADWKRVKSFNEYHTARKTSGMQLPELSLLIDQYTRNLKAEIENTIKIIDTSINYLENN